MLTIKDIVDLDEKAQFQSDVQLSAYDDPERNLALLRSYLFSTETPQRDPSATNNVSPVDLLGNLVNAYRGTRSDSRLVVIGEYGHGKSHLALALANYFGRPTDSPESAIIQDKLERALSDPAKAARFRDFKENKGEFLIIRLRGDVLESLPAQFLAALEQALATHDATSILKLPFWHEKAESYLTNLSTEQVVKANTFLAQAQYDSELPLLLKDIRAHRDVYELAVDTIEAATGIKPHLRQVNLAEAVRWTIETVVGSDKPFGGILILFDEFTLYLNRNARRHAAADLQELLNGVDNHRGLVSFVAFAQVDPETTAENLTLMGADRADMKKVLTRLPTRYRLYSLMESVIDAYLKQDEAVWAEFTGPHMVRGPLTGASTSALICFSKRYDQVLRWTPTRFQDTVTKGCFPLHPITTVLLCNLRLETVDTGVPRNVLGFVMEQLKAKQSQPAYGDKTINWVLPIALVDYFEDRLAGDAYRSYQTALRAAGPEVTDAQQAVLKALLLYELAGINVNQDDQFNFLATATGLDRPVAGNALKSLVVDGCIRQDQSTKKYELWPAAIDTGELARTIQGVIDELPFDDRALAQLNSTLASDVSGISFGLQPLDVSWGHSSDWGAQEVIITVDKLTPTALQEYARQTKLGPNSTAHEGARSYIFWGLARDEDEVQYFRTHAERVLDEAFPGDSPLPIVLMLPESDQSGLVYNFQRLRALGKLNNTQIQKFGREIVDHEEDRAQKEIRKALIDLRRVAELPLDVLRSPNTFVLPMAYRAKAKTLGETPLKRLLLETYDLAYRWRPPTFDTRYQVSNKGANALRKATANLAAAFFQDKSRSIPNSYLSDRFIRDFYERHLQKSWGILGPDFRLQKPKAAGLVQAWNLIDDTFVPGRDSVRLSPLLEQLLNPPYGFDHNTVVLLFAAWFGHNIADLRASVNGSLAFDMDETFNAWLAKGAKEFTRQAYDNTVAITRREPGSDEKELQSFISTYTEKTYSPVEATKLADNIQALAKAKGVADEWRRQADRVILDLKESSEAALAYDKEARAIEQELKQGIELKRLSTLQRKLNGLEPNQLVKTDAPTPGKLGEDLYRATQAAAKRSAAINSKLETLGKYEWNRQSLVGDKKHIVEAGYSDLTGVLDEALAALETQQHHLVAEESENELRAALQIMRTDIPLAALYEQRDYLQGLSVVTDSAIHLRDSKLAKTEAEIKSLEKEAETLGAGALKHSDHATLRKAYDRLMDIRMRYDGTPLTKTISDTKALMDKYGHFLASLSEENRLISDLQDTERAKLIRSELDRLEQANENWLGPKQIEMLAQARARLDKRLDTMRASAEAWLQKMEAQSQSAGNPVLVMKQLREQPAFLTEEQAVRVQKLISLTEQQIDQNVLTRIEQEFSRIRDPKIQEACVARLQQILNESVAKPSMASGQ